MASGERQLNILVAINNNVLSEGLRKVAEEDSRNKVFCLCNCHEAAQLDIVLTDANQDLHDLYRTYPQAKPILLDTGLKDREMAYLLVSHKIKGIISPETSVKMFHKAIRVVDKGEIWIDQKHLKTLLQRNGTLNDSGDIKSLSSQDKQIVQLISRGYRNREIGEKLCLSEHTIKAHVSRIFKHLNVKSRVQLANLIKEYDSDLP